MYAIIGLGNPGRDYDKTRHNVGFWVVEILAKRWGTALSQYVCSARMARTYWRDKEVSLIQPQTYMNGSGQTAACLFETYGIKRTDFIVVYDDIDMPLGHLRIKRTGGFGGHRGVASIITALCGPDFTRVKVGIGRPSAGIDTADFVLQPFTREEEAFILPAAQRAAVAVEAILTDGIERAMAVFNGATPETPVCALPEDSKNS